APPTCGRSPPSSSISSTSTSRLKSRTSTACRGTCAAPISGASNPADSVIVTLGDLTLDILVKPDKGAPNKPLNSPGSVTMTRGGRAANFAVWAARLGAGVRFIGKVGNDPAATLLVWDLLKEGVLPETIAARGSTATLAHVIRVGGQ